MNKSELESKHIAELHALAAEAGVPQYRMLRREELVEKLLDGKPAKAGSGAEGREDAETRAPAPTQRPRAHLWRSSVQGSSTQGACRERGGRARADARASRTRSGALRPRRRD